MILININKTNIEYDVYLKEDEFYKHETAEYEKERRL